MIGGDGDIILRTKDYDKATFTTFKYAVLMCCGPSKFYCQKLSSVKAHKAEERSFSLQLGVKYKVLQI